MEDLQSRDSHVIPFSTNPFDDLEDEEEAEDDQLATPTTNDHAHKDNNPFSSSSTDLDLMTEHWEELSDLLESPISNPFALQEFQQHLVSITRIIEGEEPISQQTTPCIELLLSENILEKLYLFSTKQRNYLSDIRQSLLVLFKSLLSRPGQPLFIHQQVLRPLNRLLRVCETAKDDKLSLSILCLLHQICLLIQENETCLDLFFTYGGGQVPSKFFIFSHLVSHIHDGGEGGARARDAMLFCLSVAERSSSSSLCDFIVSDTDFCQVLATGLSGLYSSLPVSVPLVDSEWVSPLNDLEASVPQLKNFMQALSYCNSVLQMAPLLICQAVSSLIKNGFLKQVLGPAILQASTDEAAVAIGYLCIFLNNITNPSLMKIFLQFLMTGESDGRNVCNIIIQYINNNNNNKLVAMSLELFYILINLNCEDVLLWLLLQHLLLGNHIPPAQLPSVKVRDHYCVGPKRLLELIPSCCSKAEELYLESILKSSPQVSRDSSPFRDTPSLTDTPTRLDSPVLDYRDSPTSMSSNSSSTAFVTTTPIDTLINAQEVVFEYVSPQESYYNYLLESRAAIADCARSCRVWSSCYSNCVTRDNGPAPKGDDGSMVSDTGPLLVPTLTNGLSDGEGLSPIRRRRSNSLYVHNNERFNDQVGLFMKVLMERLSQYLSNPPLINELLIKLITRLAHYPQPLIRSYLLNHHLIFKPGIPNLLQVLQGIKVSIDSLAKERAESFPSRLGRARKTLIFQAAVTNGSISEETAAAISAQFRSRSDSHLSDTPSKDNETTNNKQDEPVSRRRAFTETGRRRIKKRHKVTINMVFSIVMFGEWMKELASLAQEHSVINPELLIINE